MVAGTHEGLRFAGKAPDVGWKKLGREAEAPRWPEAMIESESDPEAVLYLWGKRRERPQRMPLVLRELRRLLATHTAAERRRK